MPDYFAASGDPATSASGSSAVMRADLAAIALGFTKIAGYTGNGGKILAINAGGTAQEAITTTGTGSGVRATSPSFTTSVISASASFDVFNTTATTVNAFGAATSLTIGATTGTATIRNATVAISGATAFTVTPPATFSGAITYGGVTLSNSVTGTGAMVLATSPTIATPVINSAAHVGGTWVADATWTLPAFTLGGTVTSNGQSFSGTIADLGTVTTADINGGTIDGVTITSPALAGTVTGTYAFGGTPTINVATAVGGTWTAAATWTLPALTLGGTVSGGGQQLNNVIIGTSTPLAGSFTTLSSTGNTTLGDTSGDTLTINAGTWTIGSNWTATRSAGALATGAVNIQTWTVNFTGDAGGATQGRALLLQGVASGANSFAESRTLLSRADWGGTVLSAQAVSVGGEVRVTNTGSLTTATVFNASVQVTSSGNITTANGFLAGAPSLTSTGAITTNYGFRAGNIGHATLVTNAIGHQADDMTAAVTLTAGFRSQMSSGTGKWGFYASGTADNAFAGNVRIGSTTAPTVALDVTGAVLISTTAGITGVLTLGGAIVGPATATVFNTVSTTVNAFGAATTLTLGAGAAASATLSFTTGIALNTGAITSDQTTVALLNTTATTVNAFGAASTALNIGHASGTNTVLGASTFSQAMTASAGLTLSGSSGTLKTGANNGTVETGVTAVYYGDGVNVTAVLTLTNVVVVVGDFVTLGVGALLFTLPTGACLIRDSYMSVAITGVTTLNDTPDAGLGTVIASGAIALLDGTATFENIITGTTMPDTNGTPVVKSAGPTAGAPLEITTGGAHTVYFNMADGWNVNPDDSGLLNGTVVIHYTRQNG